MTIQNLSKASSNVFADLGFGPDEAQNLLLRSELMIAMTNWYEAGGLTQAKAAKALGVTQPRLNQMLKGRINEFSLDALVNMATRAGFRVGLTMRPSPRARVTEASTPSGPAVKRPKIASSTAA